MVKPSLDNAGGDKNLPAAPALDPPPAEPPPDVPAGSLIADILHTPTRPHSPTSPFEFPISLPINSPRLSTDPLNIAAIPDFPSIMDSVTRVVGSPRVFGLREDNCSYVQVRKASSSLIYERSQHLPHR